jgi:hypothetical protein
LANNSSRFTLSPQIALQCPVDRAGFIPEYRYRRNRITGVMRNISRK